MAVRRTGMELSRSVYFESAALNAMVTDSAGSVAIVIKKGKV